MSDISADMVAELTEAIRILEGGDDIYSTDGDVMAGLRDYLEDNGGSYAQAEAWLAGYEYATGDTHGVKTARSVIAIFV